VPNTIDAHTVVQVYHRPQLLLCHQKSWPPHIGETLFNVEVTGYRQDQSSLSNRIRPRRLLTARRHCPTFCSPTKDTQNLGDLQNSFRQPPNSRPDAKYHTYRRNSTGRRSRCLKSPSVSRSQNPRCLTTHTDRLPAAGVRQHVTDLLEYSTETKKRNFLETVELQIGLKNYDPQRDKRTSTWMSNQLWPRRN